MLSSPHRNPQSPPLQPPAGFRRPLVALVLFVAAVVLVSPAAADSGPRPIPQFLDVSLRGTVTQVLSASVTPAGLRALLRVTIARDQQPPRSIVLDCTGDPCASARSGDGLRVEAPLVLVLDGSGQLRFRIGAGAVVRVTRESEVKP